MTTPSDASPSTPAAPLCSDTIELLSRFSYAHLPNERLRNVSKAFHDLAHATVLGDNVPESGTVTLGGPVADCRERLKGLDALLVAKDAIVRAAMTKK